jgi:hypothetical protein
LLAWLLSRLQGGIAAEANDGWRLWIRRKTPWPARLRNWRAEWNDLPSNVRDLLRLGLAGLLLLALAYPFTFTVRAYAISGRDTRVHAAGVVGASVLIGSALMLLLIIAQSSPRRVWLSAALGTWLGLVAGYGLVIQNDYATAWRLQREFWRGLVRLIPDVGDGSLILVDPSGLQDTRQIGANYWNLPTVLMQLYVFPADWGREPRVFRMVPGWEERVLTHDGQVLLDATTTFSPPSTFGVFDPTRVILMTTRDGMLARASGSFPPGDGRVELPPPPALGEPPFPRAFLYDLLVSSREANVSLPARMAGGGA